MKILNGKRTLAQQPIETALVAHLFYKDPIDPIDRLVVWNDEATDIALKLTKGFLRKNRLKKDEA